MVFSEKFEEIPIFHFQNGQLIMNLGKRLQRESWLTVLEIAALYFDLFWHKRSRKTRERFKRESWLLHSLVLSLSPIRISSTNTYARYLLCSWKHKKLSMLTGNKLSQFIALLWYTWTSKQSDRLIEVKTIKNALTQVYLGKSDRGCLIEIIFTVINE